MPKNTDGSFKKSSMCVLCAQIDCVEVSIQNDGVRVRDSKDADKVLHFSSNEWNTFLKGVKNGKFDF